MPELSKDLVALLTFLLPGFVSTWIVYSLTSHQKPAQFERVLQALVYTFLVTAVVAIERWGLEWFGRSFFIVRAWDEDARLLASILTAIAWGGVVALLTNNDWFHGRLRRLGFSKRSAHPSEWCIVFDREITYVTIHFKDGRRLYGWPQVWPTNHDKGHLYLIEPIWIHGEAVQELPYTKGILVPVGDVAHVEFAKLQERQS